ncbi:MAG: DinB family protein [Thermomicrobiales bacterium]|nr:DinB family protein [Thermomicrobiales bacterium]
MSNENHDIENPLVSQLVGLLDHTLEESPEQFGTQHWHSLLWNLHNVRPEDWDAQPAPESRTIRDIVKHIGIVFLGYENHVFGDGTRAWDDPAIDGVLPGDSPAEMISWLRETHARFRNSIARLTDSQLTELCPWGDPWTYQRIIEVVIQHPVYHIGEINYARAILQSNNDWAHMDLGRESGE